MPNSRRRAVDSKLKEKIQIDSIKYTPESDSKQRMEKLVDILIGKEVEALDEEKS